MHSQADQMAESAEQDMPNQEDPFSQQFNQQMLANNVSSFYSEDYENEESPCQQN